MKGFLGPLLCLFLFSSISLFSQETKVNDGVTIAFLKSKKVSKTFNVRASTLVHGKGSKRVMVRCKIDSDTDTALLDLNAFSLVDGKYKIRYRLADISAYYTFGGPAIRTYLKEQPLNKKGKPLEIFGLPYNPHIPDSFHDFQFDGYAISEAKYPFSSGQHIASYYDKVQFKKKFTADLYFVLSDICLEKGTHSLYYGNVKVVDVRF